MAAGAQVPVGVLALGGGVVLLWSAFTGQNPYTELRKALQTGKLDGPGEGGGPLDVNRSTAAADPADDDGTNEEQRQTTAGRPTLVPIGQGGHQLSPAAATAFRAAEQRFGRSIPITDSARDFDSQLANHRRNPRRFGSPTGNAHVMGQAVDVNLGAVGAKPQGSNPAGWLRDPGYRRLFDAMTATGWCNWQMNRGDLGGKIPEPWHFSHGRCA